MRTPAAEVIDLRREIAALERDLAEERAKRSRAEEQHARYTTLSGGRYGVSFGGIPMAQIWADLVLWETLLNVGEYRAVFELGTWEGGFSWWLWAQCEARNIGFRTYDAVEPERNRSFPLRPVPQFKRLDIFASSEDLGAFFRLYEPCVVFCDNGNKPRELRTFAAELRHPDSILVVHDWGTEMAPAAVPTTVEMIHREFCEELRSISRVFRLKREPDA